jgi:hypothetical protein
MVKNKKLVVAFIICIGVTACSALLCFLNRDILKRPVFQEKTYFADPSFVKYEKDGNLYIADSGGFRLICMTPEGKINYKISINAMEEYTRICDSAVDEQGNL